MQRTHSHGHPQDPLETVRSGTSAKRSRAPPAARTRDDGRGARNVSAIPQAVRKVRSAVAGEGFQGIDVTREGVSKAVVFPVLEGVFPYAGRKEEEATALGEVWGEC